MRWRLWPICGWYTPQFSDDSENDTSVDSPACSSTFLNFLSIFISGTEILRYGWVRNSITVSLPAREPTFVTLNVAVTVSRSSSSVTEDWCS
ncbi:hypothetical protein PF001_g31329 [Phytophthora fragariae]|uniref:Uncharacterized protein n=1 Tax=Phytophthora fragariae TaxID=53985 RepID=A0A6A4B0G2_9STRA|nr:hypothetical protein PF003_g37591 [Phytophthora fragariae]KAE9264329.1 hypothetical protein PF001_g31329 [Phytophthora fragariae]